MAELATIARPYAQALFQTSKANLAGTAAWLDDMTAIAADPQFRQFASNPSVTAGQVFEVMSGVGKTALPEAAKNFMRTVIENDRISALPEIAAQFRVLKNTQSGSSDAIVYSAFPLEGAELADVVDTLQKRFGRELIVKVELDRSLIGGVRVVVGDEVLDTSVKARLEQMKMALVS